MDLRPFYTKYRDDGWGRAAYEPSMMASLLLYAYCLGVRSSRQIKRLCERDIGFRVIAGSQAPEVARLVFAMAEPLLVGIAEVEDEALAAVTEARQVLSGGTPGAQETQQLLEAVGSLREALKKMEGLEEQVAGRPKAAAALERTHDRVKGWQAEVLKALGV
ncbi:MAG: transposase [Anaerolineae bacterium]|nr:transposase [Anaerolineae bacterium]